MRSPFARRSEQLLAELVAERARAKELQELLGASEVRALELQGIARAAERHAEVLAEEVTYLRELVAEKDRTLLEMRREGFDPAPREAPTAAVKDDRPKLDQRIRSTMEAFADPGTSDYYRIEEQARRELADGASSADVCESIRRGSRLNPHHL